MFRREIEKKLVNSLQPHIDFSSYKRLHVDRTFCARKKQYMRCNSIWIGFVDIKYLVGCSIFFTHFDRHLPPDERVK